MDVMDKAKDTKESRTYKIINALLFLGGMAFILNQVLYITWVLIGTENPPTRISLGGLLTYSGGLLTIWLGREVKQAYFGKADADK